MAMVPTCYKISGKDQSFLFPKGLTRQERGFTRSSLDMQGSCGCYSSSSGNTGRRWLNDSLLILLKPEKINGARDSRGALCNRGTMPLSSLSEVAVLPKLQKVACHLGFGCHDSFQRKELSTVCHSSNSSRKEKHLRALDSYFGKIKHDFYQLSSDSLDESAESEDKYDRSKSEKELRFLDNYLSKVNKGKSMTSISSASDGGNIKTTAYSIKGNTDGGKKPKFNMKLKVNDAPGVFNNLYDNTSDFYFISILASINIAVFLFEMASPIRNSDLELFSLPMVYGAKINDLILVGEWWRLVTPMFLHSGILHVALGCWMLLTFGPQVCKIYGSFTFFLIYILGGISGNLISFLHTPEPTVGGTGPVFAIVGAWLVYHVQNRDVTSKDFSESMFQKALLGTALSLILSNFCPIDDWTHFGAAFTGMAFGFLTCTSILQADDSSPKSGQEKGIAMIKRKTNPWKSLVVFSFFIVLLSLLLFVLEPPLNSLAADRFV